MSYDKFTTSEVTSLKVAMRAGWLHLEAQEYDAADQVFQKLVNETAKNDDYGWLGIASILLKSIPATRKKVRHAAHCVLPIWHFRQFLLQKRAIFLCELAQLCRAVGASISFNGVHLLCAPELCLIGRQLPAIHP